MEDHLLCRTFKWLLLNLQRLGLLCLLCLPYPFLKIEKIALIIWKNALIVFIHRLNVHLCSNSKCYFKSTKEEKLRAFFNVSLNTLILKNLPCPVKILIGLLCIVFTPEKQTDFHVMSTLYRINYCCISKSYPIWCDQYI